MIEICDKASCLGCGVCENICPQKAIKMEYSAKGFLEPKIDQKLCIDCKLCENVCPIKNKIEKILPLKIYACKNKDAEKRNTSSSGGVFQELSEYVLNKDGFVFGAAYNEKIKVVHEKVKDINELQKLKGSKYLQSNVLQSYNEVCEELANNKDVLFSGTPCQIQAMKNMKKQNEEKLLLVDVVCHGVPSPGVFEDYKKHLENQYNSKIVKVNFRYKYKNETQNVKVDFENGESYISNYLEGDIFYRLFFKDLILRNSCYDCKFKDFERVSDISIADFWGIEKTSAKEFADKKGISLVLINNEKGLKYFDSIKDKLDFVQIERNDCEPYNCFKPFKISENVDKMWNTYIEKGLHEVVKKFL